MLVRRIDLVVIFTLLLISNAALATTIKAFSFDELVEQSNLIIHARVVNVQTLGSAYAIRTQITFEVNNLIKGNISGNGNRLVVSFLGGRLNNKVQQIVGLRYPKLNEEGIYFLKLGSQLSINPILGWDQGHFLVEFDPLSQSRVVLSSGGKALSVKIESGQGGNLISSGVAKGIKALKQNQPAGKMDVQTFISEIRGRLQP